MTRSEVESIFSRGFGQPLVETDVQVRSFIASTCGRGEAQVKEYDAEQ